MRHNSFVLSALFLLAQSFEAKSKVTFRLINVKGENPSVIANNQEITMNLEEFPVFKATLDVEPPVTYHYAVNVNGQRNEEGFERTYEENPSQSTLNDFFNRSITVKNHPLLPRAYNQYKKTELSKLYDDTYVATILVETDPVQLNALYLDSKLENKILGSKVTYISPYAVKQFTNATFGISGQSTRKAPKLSYKIGNLKNDKGKELYNRTSLKLRAEHMDPSYLRDKIYGDILNSLGVPTAQNKFARLFINGEDVGLFDVSDDISNKRFLRESFNGGKKYSTENILFKADYYPDGNSYGDLGYYGETSPMYGIYYYKGGDDNADGDALFNQHLKPFLLDIHNYPQTKQLNMDKEMFLKAMTVEYACGAMDNYWLRPGNFFVYKDLTDNKWYFIDVDFHYTFGVGGETKVILDAYISNYTLINNAIPNTPRPLLDNLRSVPENDEFFMGVFKRLLETSFNIKAIGPRIDSLAELIREDVQWDVTLPKVSKTPGIEGKLDELYDFEAFEANTKDETLTEPIDDVFPLKYWIITKGNLMAEQLGIPYPTELDTSLGFVEPPKSDKKDDNNNSSSLTGSKNGALTVFSSNKSFILSLFLSLLVIFVF